VRGSVYIQLILLSIDKEKMENEKSNMDAIFPFSFFVHSGKWKISLDVHVPLLLSVNNESETDDIYTGPVANGSSSKSKGCPKSEVWLPLPPKIFVKYN